MVVPQFQIQLLDYFLSLLPQLNRFSSPRNNLRMLLRCLKVMKMAKTVQACHKAGFAGYKNAHAIGNTIVAEIDPRDTNLVKMTMHKKSCKRYAEC